MIRGPAGAKPAALKRSSLRKGSELYRITLPDYPSPLHFSTDGSGRWDTPAGSCYLSDGVDSAFAETFGRGVVERFAPGTVKLISETSLLERHLYAVELLETFRVGELCGAGLARLNLDNRINTTPDYAVPQQWARWVSDHPRKLDGLRYHSRHLGDTLCIAAFKRSRPKLRSVDRGPLLHWRCHKTGRTIWDVLEAQGWAVV